MKKPTLSSKQGLFPYADFAAQVRQFDWAALSSPELQALIAASDKSQQPLLFSLLKEVVFRCTGLTLFDTQLAAACSLARGRIAELPTGEGKTLAAAVTAAWLALQGRQVHILTFNDYLARRDYTLNRAIFAFCGLNSGFIQEKSDFAQRRQAYACNIVYASAKQVGFDYLKNFLCTKAAELLPLNFDAALVDEADSILIDEARLPLVVAGADQSAAAQILKIDELIAGLDVQDVIYDAASHTFWLTDSGIASLEKALRLTNLFDEENADILTFINAAIEARFLLIRDKDYLVKDRQILIIEQTTGRIALRRKFPAALQQAVKVKEKLLQEEQTVIYNSMPLQFFLRQYQLLSGMTGTAAPSAPELKNMYGLTVDVIPPHVPSVRREYPDCLCRTEDEKVQAILQQVKQAHALGQPVLLGTQSVLQSEQYSRLFRKQALPHQVLNARNDEEEAAIIADAGRPYAITISTNMAGRGVDIRLGGQNEEDKAMVVRAGGLLVIGCGLNESYRIDRQLLGRSARQGEPGASMFFVSLEDPLLARYFDAGKLSMSKMRQQIRRVQRYEDGRAAEARYMLSKYAYILELQRQRITAYRETILREDCPVDFLRQDNPALFAQYLATVGLPGVQRAEKQLALYFINQHWSDYLSTMENRRHGIHLAIVGGLNPLDEYQRMGTAAFSEMANDIRADVLSYMETCTITADGIDLAKAGLMGATSTCSYMIDDSSTQFSRLPQLLASLSQGMNGTLFSLSRTAARVVQFLQDKFR